MNIGLTFIPPQVITFAGAELTVLLRVISQSDEGRVMEYDLPLIVQEVSNVTIDLESSFTSILPGTTISLQYSIENQGNIDLQLEPNLELPFGWIQNTQLADIDLDWTQSKNLIISITAGDNARSGEIKLVMDSGQRE